MAWNHTVAIPALQIMVMIAMLSVASASIDEEWEDFKDIIKDPDHLVPLVVIWSVIVVVLITLMGLCCTLRKINRENAKAKSRLPAEDYRRYDPDKRKSNTSSSYVYRNSTEDETEPAVICNADALRDAVPEGEETTTPRDAGVIYREQTTGQAGPSVEISSNLSHFGNASIPYGPPAGLARSPSFPGNMLQKQQAQPGDMRSGYHAPTKVAWIEYEKPDDHAKMNIMDHTTFTGPSHNGTNGDFQPPLLAPGYDYIGHALPSERELAQPLPQCNANRRSKASVQYESVEETNLNLLLSAMQDSTEQ